MNEEYELLSHEEIERLKREAERYKNNPFIKNGTDDKLYTSIIDMTKAINRLSYVFEEVKQKIIQEQESGEGPDAKMDKILEQNKHIAQALVSFGEKLEEISQTQINDDVADIDIGEDNKNEIDDELEKTINNQEQINEPDIETPKPQPMTNTNQDAQNIQQPQQQSIPIQNEAMPQQQNMQQQNSFNQIQNENPLEMDYQSWNYGKPNKPGVSQSKPPQTRGFGSFNQQQPQQQPQQPQQNTQRMSVFENENQQQGFGSFNQQQQPQQPQNNFQNDQTTQFPQQQTEYGGDFGFGPQALNNTQQNNQNQDQNMPNLKPLNQEAPKKKKRTFGLF